MSSRLDVRFTREQIMFLEDLITNYAEMRAAKMRYAYGISQCGQCLENIREILGKIRKREEP